MEKHSGKKRKFKLFDTQREGKGVSKDDVYTKPDLKGFFIKYKQSFGRLLSVNLLMVLGNFPLLFFLFSLAPFSRIPYTTPAYESFPLLRGLLLQQTEISASTLATFGMEGLQVEANAMTTGTYVLFGLSLLVLFTFGLVNAGSTYILRNMVRGDPVFILSDFFYAVRRNWKQALPFGIIDLIILLWIPFDIYYVLSSMDGFFGTIMFGAVLAIGLIYFWMRFYIYLQMVTFDLSLKKLLKNSLIFALLGFKRNLMATLGILTLLLIVFLLAFGFQGILFSTAILLPLVLLFSNGAFMSTYAAYYKIKEIMIDPYVSPEDTADTDGSLPEDGENTALPPENNTDNSSPTEETPSALPSMGSSSNLQPDIQPDAGDPSSP